MKGRNDVRAVQTSSILGCLGLALGPFTGSAREAAQPPAPDPPIPLIAVKRTELGRVAYTEHVGAYWAIGRHFAKLREYMSEHGQPGPMFVRFSRSPAAVPANLLRTQTGFFVTGDHHPGPPYETATREAELVAYMIVDAPFATPSRYAPAMRDWVRDHGYVAVGPVTEVYPVDSGGGPAIRRIELQMTIRAAEPRMPNPPAHADSGPAEVGVRSAGPAESPRVRPGQGSISRAKRTEQYPANEAGPRNAEANTSQGAGVDERGLIGVDVPSPAAPVTELVDRSRFDELAVRLLPTDRELPPSLQVWVGQVVFRVEAAGKGAKQVYPGEGEAVSSLAEAIARRYEMVSADFTLDPLDRAVVRVDPLLDAHAAEKQALTRELDSLLGRIALRSIAPEALMDELTHIIQRADNLLQVEHPSTVPQGGE